MPQLTLSHLTLYSRPGCHLCDEMKAVVDLVAARVPLSLEIINIDDDPALTERYGLEIPVLLVNGGKVAKYRIEEAVLERTLRARATA
ncbi:MAG: glutaredoxin family protein [Vicinamibacterales bacterium]